MGQEEGSVVTVLPSIRVNSRLSLARDMHIIQAVSA